MYPIGTLSCSFAFVKKKFEFDLQDFIVNLAGMEFGAGAHPGLQVSQSLNQSSDL